MLLLFCCADRPASAGPRPESQPAPSPRSARRLALVGKYDQAVAIYDELGKKPGKAVAAACGRAEIDRVVGAYREGLARLRSVEKPGAETAAWHVAMAGLLAEVGEYAEAKRHNELAISRNPRNFRARWQLGRLQEIEGGTKEAIETYRFFDEVMTGPELPDSAEDLTYLGLGFHRYSVLSRHRDIVRRTRHVLTEVYQEAFEFVDAAYWPARLAAAELLLAKHNLQEAGPDFDLICEQNAKVPAAHVGLGRIALENWNFEEAEAKAKAALDINPNSVAARLLLADVRMTERRYQDAATEAEQALATNPQSIEALSVLAAARLRSSDEAAFERTVARIQEINPAPAQLYYTLGVWLAAGRQYQQAEESFKRAIELAPWWAGPMTDLGHAYMDMGEESSARKMLEASFALDSFDSRTLNVLELLDSLDRFSRLESEHFIIKYDKQADALIAPYLAESLEQVYDEVCDDFGARLDKPTIIEVFPDHMGFSVRVTGRPFIATVGACSGRVIAMMAPRGGAPFGRFNWATVLRHEFTHAVTLAATENRIPHWMTEGMAVYEEPAPRSWETKHLLCQAFRQDRLFTLESIDWGFMRPRRPNDRSLAYAQSEWMMEYAIERFGFDVVAGFLSAFRGGQTQEAAFKSVLKIDTRTFDRDFRSWAAEQVAKWGLPTDRLEEPDKLEDRLETDRDDPALWGKLAEAYLLDGDIEGAEEAAGRALALDENEIRALEVISRALVGRMLAEKDEAARRRLIDQVEPYARRLEKLDPQHPAAMKYLGYLEQAWGQWQEAAERFERYQRRFPEDPDSYRRLAGIYFEQDRPDQALKELEALFRLVDDEPAVAKTIADAHAERGDARLAARWYRRALDIDPYDCQTHAGLALQCLTAGDYATAEREYKIVCDLWPEKDVGYQGLAKVHRGLGKPELAEALEKKADEARGKAERRSP